MYLRIMGACFLGMTTAVAAIAQQDFTDIIKERQEGMKESGGAMKALKPLMEGTADYDAEAVREQAQIIVGNAGEHLVAWFPEGSDVGDSAAKPEIWSEQDRFEALAEQLATYAEGLDAAADRGLGDAEPAEASTDALLGTAPAEDAFDVATASPDAIYGKIGETCGTCHETYRMKNE